jgi:hypothetical protein
MGSCKSPGSSRRTVSFALALVSQGAAELKDPFVTFPLFLRHDNIDDFCLNFLLLPAAGKRFL